MPKPIRPVRPSRKVLRTRWRARFGSAAAGSVPAASAAGLSTSMLDESRTAGTERPWIELCESRYSSRSGRGSSYPARWRARTKCAGCGRCDSDSGLTSCAAEARGRSGIRRPACMHQPTSGVASVLRRLELLHGMACSGIPACSSSAKRRVRSRTRCTACAAIWVRAGCVPMQSCEHTNGVLTCPYLPEARAPEPPSPRQPPGSPSERRRRRQSAAVER
ncbi:hypothetical protein FKP32DRAFT_856629 [Trametes sanguinea]|nr:hypothetical protein FKP32DRAFT_856629 [Trametes sanguinea]